MRVRPEANDETVMNYGSWQFFIADIYMNNNDIPRIACASPDPRDSAETVDISR
jgi:hypothetical protein